MVNRRCLGVPGGPRCGVLIAKGTYCARCEKIRNAQNWQQKGPHYGTEWKKIVKAAIAAQPWCSLCGATTDLTGDHIIADQQRWTLDTS
jgi:hypothetical protein